MKTIKKLFRFAWKIISFLGGFLLVCVTAPAVLFCVCWLIGFILHFCGMPYLPHDSDSFIESENVITGFGICFFIFVICTICYFCYNFVKDIYNWLKEIWEETCNE